MASTLVGCVEGLKVSLIAAICSGLSSPVTVIDYLTAVIFIRLR